MDSWRHKKRLSYEPKCYKNFSCKDTLCKNICKNNFLTEVQKIAKHNNALLMFDEIIKCYKNDF